MGDKPEFYGVIATGTKANPTRVGKIAVWINETAILERNQPPLHGRIEIDGKRYHVALWQHVEDV